MRTILLGVGLVVDLVWVASSAQVTAQDQSAGVSVADSVEVQYAGSALALPTQEFGKWLPQELRTRGGEVRVSVLPLSDSAGLHIDTVSSLPSYLLSEYDRNCKKVLVLLRRTGTGYVSIWNSCIIEGYGFVAAEDLNLDGQAEIITNNIIGVHTFESVFFWEWAGDSLTNITPGGCLGGISDICGSVKYTVTDSGTVIQTYPNQDSRFKTYFLAKGDSVIRVVETETNRK